MLVALQVSSGLWTIYHLTSNYSSLHLGMVILLVPSKILPTQTSTLSTSLHAPARDALG